MAKIVPLFSSSKGNSYYIQGNGSAILIDAGRNLKQLELAMAENDLSMRDVQAIFVTHEHSDHISA
ncbi:MAG: MBL fold metallo-hydrolase, partial [Ruminococcus sp.]|nr:MBL fold metallo-hydrolase [Ruminococcus sp.]